MAAPAISPQPLYSVANFRTLPVPVGLALYIAVISGSVRLRTGCGSRGRFSTAAAPIWGRITDGAWLQAVKSIKDTANITGINRLIFLGFILHHPSLDYRLLLHKGVKGVGLFLLNILLGLETFDLLRLLGDHILIVLVGVDIMAADGQDDYHQDGDAGQFCHFKIAH